MNTVIFWFCLTFFFIFMESFYSMMEMAIVSFNKIRLQYYLSKNNKRAQLIHQLLKNPSTLFGTTLLGVNIALQFGSECSRQFYEAMQLNPNIAPITQVLLVLIFAELAPIFAARHYAEHVSMLGIPVLYGTSRVVTPFLWMMRGITKFADYLMGTVKRKEGIFITREELQKVIEEQEEESFALGESQELNLIATNIFTLRGKEATQVMEPLNTIPKLPSNSTIGHMREVIQKKDVDYIPIYHRNESHIIGIANPRDLIRLKDSQRIRDHIRQPWFITRKTKVLEILKQFRRNNQTYAVVLNDKGGAIGILTLDEIVEEIFGEAQYGIGYPQLLKRKTKKVIDLTLPGDMRIIDFNAEYKVNLDSQGVETLGELFNKALGRHPEKGESIYIEPFELTAKETSLLEVKKVHIRTKVI